MQPRLLAPLAAAGAIVVALAGCVPNNAVGGSVDVAMNDDSCVVSQASVAAGAVTFRITNSGSDVNEFEILADDKLRIVGEKENVTPGQTVSYVALLDAGSYYTACRFKQAGSFVGVAQFTVTAAPVATGADTQLVGKAVAHYVAYLRSQASQLVPAVAEFAKAYMAGDDDTARALYPSSRVSYESIEPTAEAFGDLDPKIDYREVDAAADALDWTGFHRIEKDLWPPVAGALGSDGTSAFDGWTASTPAERQRFGQGLIDDVDELSALVADPGFTVSLADISNGAISLLDEVAARKISGEEDWWSHTDLWDFSANVRGAAVAFQSVKDLAAGTGDEGAQLVADIENRFAALEGLLASYGSLDTGFVPYDTVTDAQRRQLSDGVNALAEPLSKLTHAVLGVDG
ncbi:MAG: peptidase family protein [Rhodoglobus sp.]|nr:peptidase family protein [Rhodoglobus sp.]